MHVLLTTDWSVLASIATVAGTAIAAAALVGTGLALAVQIWLARTSSGIDNLWRLVDKWDGDDMVSKRARAAQAMKRHHDTDDVADVLNFFEQLGYLVRKKAIDKESAWAMLSDWALPYYRAAQYFITADRAVDETYWEDFEGLNQVLLQVESRRRRKREGDVQPTSAQVQKLLESESAMVPGQPKPSKKWRRVQRAVSA
jgi:hypothetical protein